MSPSVITIRAVQTALFILSLQIQPVTCRSILTEKYMKYIIYYRTCFTKPRADTSLSSKRGLDQDCAELDFGVSQASLRDPGPLGRSRLMRLEASERNTGESVCHWDKPTADEAQWRLLPQTKPCLGSEQSEPHYSAGILSLCNQVNVLWKSSYYPLKNCVGFALKITVIQYIIIINSGLYFVSHND